MRNLKDADELAGADVYADYFEQDEEEDFTGWTVRDQDGREVGTGAYIVKLKSYVKLGSSGKEAKQESTSVWGVRRSPKPNTDYLKQVAK